MKSILPLLLVRRYIICAAFSAFVFAAGCKISQRPPQNGTVESTNDDGTIMTTQYEKGRTVYQSVRSAAGSKMMERFSFHLNPAVQKISGDQFPDKDSTIQYGPQGQILSTYTTFRPSDGTDWIVTGMNYFEDGSLAAVTDSSGSKSYYHSGLLQFERRKIGDKAERHTFYDTLGIKREEWETLNGVRHGIVKVFNAKGTLTRKEIYKNGTIVR